MKKILFLSLTAATWYLAGMYEQKPMMVLAFMELMIFFCMFLLSRSLRRHFRVNFDGKGAVITEKERTACRMEVQNSGSLPIGRFALFA
ncbi:MAG: hypothetical protein ACOX8H_05835 [Ruminococcus sp.]|jgi:hypothetical protein